MTSPLEGVKVLDLSRVFAGPFAGRMLCDLGADVVKVEPPEGDVTRTFGVKPQTPYFRQQNAGKRSITVDLRTEDGRALVARLATVADVVLENFRPGVLSRFGLGWAELSALNPRLVMASISGFGQDGPERDRAAYAGVIHAETGVIARRHAQQGGGLPSDLETSMADTVSGLHGVIGVLAALRHRDATGVGQHVDIAMVDAMLACDDFLPVEQAAHVSALARAERGGDEPPEPQHSIGNYEMLDAPGGPIIVMGEFKWIWHSINTRLGVADPTPEGASLDEKIQCRRDAWHALVASFDDRADLLAALDTANLAWGAVKSGPEALQSPTVRHRGSLVEITDDTGTYTVIRSPYRFSAAESGVRGGAPRQGEHEAEILADWLGEA